MDIQSFTPTNFGLIQLGYATTFLIPLMLGFGLIAKFKKTMTISKEASLYGFTFMVAAWSSVFYVFFFALPQVNSEHEVYMEEVKQDLGTQGITLEGDLPKWDNDDPVNVKLINGDISYDCTVTYTKNAEYLDFQCKEEQETLNLQDILAKQ